MSIDLEETLETLGRNQMSDQESCRICGSEASETQLRVKVKAGRGWVEFETPGTKCSGCNIEWFTTDQAKVARDRVEEERAKLRTNGSDSPYAHELGLLHDAQLRRMM